jgi:lipopolysaccharide export system protein LptA
MPLKIYRLRLLLAATAVVLTMVVAGMYFYARWRAANFLSAIPGRIGIEIKQTANGFQLSKSDGKRTLFTIQASNVKEFKLNGNAELHNVSIILYGRDSSRFDQIYGDDFAYNEKTGDVTAKGDVQIDLVSNPAGLASPDQSTPKELKNPIHLKTRDLVFNKNTGNAATDARVEFRTPQATGWAVGVTYAGKSNMLTLASQVHVVLNGPDAEVIEAEHGVITSDPHEITLDRPHLVRDDGTMKADRAVFYLGKENQVERVLATGNVTTVTRAQDAKRSNSAAGSSALPSEPVTGNLEGNSNQIAQPSEIRSRSDQAEFLLAGAQNLLRTATMTGNVHVEQSGAQPMQGDAGRVVMDFAGRNELQKVHALDGVRLTQKADSTKPANKPEGKGPGNGPQDFELTAPVIDFFMAQGHVLRRAVTSGAAQITIAQAVATIPAATQIASAPAAAGRAVPSQPHSGQASGAQVSTPQTTVVTAGKFLAQFATSDGRTRLASLHGAPNARIVNSTPGQPDRVSTSDSVDATLLPLGGIDSITQLGNVAYNDGQPLNKRMQAWSNSAHYTPADQMLLLTGNPRVTNGGMATTAKTIRINRATGEALALGDVKSTYNDLKEQPDGALLASSSPIHVTANSMTAHGNAGTALYAGNARLWQDANIIEAPTIQFERDRRFVTAQGTPGQPVQTILVQAEKDHAEKVQAEKVQTQKAQPDHAPGENATAGSGKPENSPAPKKIVGKGSEKPSPLGGSSPISITAAKLTYADSERKVHYEGGVMAKGVEFTAAAKTADAYLLPRSQTSSPQSFGGPGQLDHMVAQGDILVQQPKRRAEGQNLVYTAADDKFVLTGGASNELPSIFDAEQGKITGVSLTFFRRDDRVLVDGAASTPVVTQTRVAR